MKSLEYETALARARLFAACHNQMRLAIECAKWALHEAACDLDRDVRIFCVQSVPKHLPGEKVLRLAKEIYSFALPENPSYQEGPGAQPVRQAGTRSPQRA